MRHLKVNRLIVTIILFALPNSACSDRKPQTDSNINVPRNVQVSSTPTPTPTPKPPERTTEEALAYINKRLNMTSLQIRKEEMTPVEKQVAETAEFWGRGTDSEPLDWNWYTVTVTKQNMLIVNHSFYPVRVAIPRESKPTELEAVKIRRAGIAREIMRADLMSLDYSSIAIYDDSIRITCKVGKPNCVSRDAVENITKAKTSGRTNDFLIKQKIVDAHMKDIAAAFAQLIQNAESNKKQ
jgi:hypothetical protein